MCSVFSTTLKIDRDKNSFREYNDGFDAQTVCKKLHGFRAKSIGALVSTSDILFWITSAKFESWKGTTESFILKQDQVRPHESLVDADKYFSEIQKKIPK